MTQIKACSYVLAMAICLGTGETLAQKLLITNEASGIACYSAQDLFTAHASIGYYNHDMLKLLIAQRKCFVMGKHWEATITELIDIKSMEGVKMVKVTLRRQTETRHVWSLRKNFDL